MTTLRSIWYTSSEKRSLLTISCISFEIFVFCVNKVCMFRRCFVLQTMWFIIPVCQNIVITVPRMDAKFLESQWLGKKGSSGWAHGLLELGRHLGPAGECRDPACAGLAAILASSFPYVFNQQVLLCWFNWSWGGGKEMKRLRLFYRNHSTSLYKNELCWEVKLGEFLLVRWCSGAPKRSVHSESENNTRLPSGAARWASRPKGEGCSFGSPGRAHAWVVHSSHPSGDASERQPVSPCFSPFFSPSLPLSLKIN